MRKEIYIYRPDETEKLINETFSNKKLKIAVVGSRRLTTDNVKENIRESINNILNYYSLTKDDILLVSGGAKGVDTLAEQIAQEEDIDMVVIRPNYKEVYPKRAPFERNTGIAKVADIMLAYKSLQSKNPGTNDVVKKFQKFHPGKSLRIINF